jgi:hypothetical protein
MEPTEEQCLEVSRSIVESNRKRLDEIGATDGSIFMGVHGLTTYLEPVFIKKVKKANGSTKIVEEIVHVDTPKAASIRLKALLAEAEFKRLVPPKEYRVAGEGGGPILLSKLTVEFVKPKD